MSLLWPSQRSAMSFGNDAWRDLAMDRIVATLTLPGARDEAIAAICHAVPTEEKTIRYRLEITGELLEHPALGACFSAVVPIAEQLRYYVSRPDRGDWTPLQEMTWRIRELEHYVRLLETFHGAFERVGGSLRSEGLRELWRVVEEARSDRVFEALQSELPGLLSVVDNFRSISVGINLSAGLVPTEATLLTVSSERYAGSDLLHRIAGNPDRTGIAQLHSTLSGSSAGNSLLVPLFKDLSEIMQKAARPAAATLRRFVGINSSMFVAMADEFAFFAAAVALSDRLKQAGLPVCSPDLLPAAARSITAANAYNLDLAIRTLDSSACTVVTNDFVSGGESGRITVVTGPNSGGKTTFLQAIGLAQVMTQLGLFVPARAFSTSAVSSVLTHYPALEDMTNQTGRFGEEAQRLRALVESVTPGSLVLLNESLSSTGLSEAVFLAEDLLHLLRDVGCTVIFVTHLHDLSAGPVQSLVARTTPAEDGEQPTYRVVPGMPQGRSYAQAIARRHGVDGASLRELAGSATG